MFRSTSSRNLRAAAACLSLCMTVIYFKFLSPLWHVNDDIGILFIATGTLDGNPSWQIPFIEPFAAIATRIAVLLAGPAGYALILVALLAASFWLLTNSIVAAAQRSSKSTLAIVIFTLAAVGITYFITLMNLSFTIVAGVSTAALISSLTLQSVGHFPNQGFRMILHCALLALALSFRLNAALIALLILAPLWVPSTQRASLAAVRPNVSIPSVFLGTWLINHFAKFLYSTTYRTWLEFNAVRGMLQGNRIITQTTDIELSDLGWSRNHFNMFRNFLHFDPRYFGTGSLRHLADSLGASSTTPIQSVGRETLQDAMNILQHVALLAALLLALAIFDSATTSRPRRLPFLCVQIFAPLILAYCSVLYMLEIRFPFRVEITVIVSLVLAMSCAYLVSSTTPGDDANFQHSQVKRSYSLPFKAGRIVLISALFVQLGFLHENHFSDSITTRSDRVHRLQRQEHIVELMTMRANDEITLVMPGSDLLQNRSPFDDSAIVSDRIIRFGWSIGAPNWVSHNEKLQIDVREVLLVGTDLKGNAVPVSILSHSFPKLISSYIFEESGVLVEFTKGPCATTDSATPCLWRISR